VLAAAALIGLLGVDLWQASASFHDYESGDHPASTSEALAYVRTHAGGSRAYPDAGYSPLAFSSRHISHGTPLVAAFLSRVPHRLEGFDLEPSAMTPAKLAASSIRFWIASAATPPPRAVADKLVERHRSSDGEVVYELDPASRLPRAYVVEQHRVIEDDSERLAWVNSERFAPWTEVLLPRPPSDQRNCAEQPSIRPSTSIAEYRDDRVLIRASTPRCAMLVLSDMFHPGWTATINRHHAEVLPANGVFRAVALEPGEHLIEFRFWSRGLTPALVLSAAVLLGLLALALLKRSRARGSALARQPRR
jgi:hypothetical protein